MSRPSPPPKVVVAPAAPQAKAPAAEPKDSTGKLHARGIVVDEGGRPVPGAEVVAFAFTSRETRGVSGADGSFAVPVSGRMLDGTSLLARSPGGDRLGVFHYDVPLTTAQAEAPSRIVLKPGRRVSVRVADASKAPIAGSTVDVIGGFQVLAQGTTGADGVVSLAIPAEARVDWVVALKSGRGLDYAEFGPIDEKGRSQFGAPASDLPATINLVLDGIRTAKIRAVDVDGKPIAGAGFGPWLIHKEGRRSFLNLGDYRAFTATTDADGVATFDWLPQTKDPLQFWPQSEDYANRRVILEEGVTGPVTAKLTRNEAIRGHVSWPDGSPAPSILIGADGTGQGMDDGGGRARSAADGSYEMRVPSGEAYAVYVEDEAWAAQSRLDVVILPSRPVDGVDFRLSRGTMIRGSVTVGPGDRPASGQYIRLDESTFTRAPAEVRVEGDRRWREVRRQFGAMTDGEGRYSIRVGPGTFTIMGPPRTSNEKVTVRDEPELIRDFRMPRPEKGPITGQVVASAGDKGIAGAKVEIVALNNHGRPFTVTADADGRFQTERDLDRLVVHAQNPDGSLGAIVEVGAEDPEVVIAISPTATATGLLLDEQGKPASNQPLDWGRSVYLDEEQKLSSTCFAPKVVTDAAGKFTLPSLVVGQEYDISVRRENVYHATGMVRPKAPGPIDLGTLQIGAYRPKPTAEEMSSFRKGGPGAGDPAPPIEGTTLDGRPLKLEDFRGKFVLLDFWATWCGPCIGEIPQLQAVHDAFGKDGRLVILSLSVDEKIDEPRQFQEKRKLPWSQGFLGRGIHSAIPDSFGVRAIPAFVLVGPDGKIVAKGMRGDDIKKEIARTLEKTP